MINLGKVSVETKTEKKFGSETVSPFEGRTPA